VVTSADEPGEPLDISGTIYRPDGTNPAAGMVLFIYHTDATGYYNKNDDPGHPRIRGWMQTGADGKYEFRTIKPAPYPQRTTPAHIHAHVYGAGYSERSIDDYWFEGDPFITAKELARVNEQGSSPAIVTLKRDGEGVLRGVRDIKLKY
jgi:protocatechuate 3,4-dioxygenase beta subunit